MSFFKNGPSIPDELLERRDQGRVTFLCGAEFHSMWESPLFMALGGNTEYFS